MAAQFARDDDQTPIPLARRAAALAEKYAPWNLEDIGEDEEVDSEAEEEWVKERIRINVKGGSKLLRYIISFLLLDRIFRQVYIKLNDISCESTSSVRRTDRVDFAEAVFLLGGLWWITVGILRRQTVQLKLYIVTVIVFSGYILALGLPPWMVSCKELISRWKGKYRSYGCSEHDARLQFNFLECNLQGGSAVQLHIIWLMLTPRLLPTSQWMKFNWFWIFCMLVPATAVQLYAEESRIWKEFQEPHVFRWNDILVIFTILCAVNLIAQQRHYYLSKGQKNKFLSVFWQKRAVKKLSNILELMLPDHVVTPMLKSPGMVIAEEVRCASVLFSVIVDFDQFARSRSPSELLAFLNDHFTLFDSTCIARQVQKIETIGEEYVAAVGVIPEDVELGVACGHGVVLGRLIRVAADMLEQRDSPVRLKMGIHTGPLVAGVIGRKLPRFRLFGDTINTAARMMQKGAEGEVQFGEATREHLPSWVRTKGPNVIELKGLGAVNAYFLDREGSKSMRAFRRTRFRTAPSENALSRASSDFDGDKIYQAAAPWSPRWRSEEMQKTTSLKEPPKGAASSTPTQAAPAPLPLRESAPTLQTSAAVPPLHWRVSAPWAAPPLGAEVVDQRFSKSMSAPAASFAAAATPSAEKTNAAASASSAAGATAKVVVQHPLSSPRGSASTARRSSPRPSASQAARASVSGGTSAATSPKTLRPVLEPNTAASAASSSRAPRRASDPRTSPAIAARSFDGRRLSVATLLLGDLDKRADDENDSVRSRSTVHRGSVLNASFASSTGSRVTRRTRKPEPLDIAVDNDGGTKECMMLRFSQVMEAEWLEWFHLTAICKKFDQRMDRQELGIAFSTAYDAVFLVFFNNALHDARSLDDISSRLLPFVACRALMITIVAVWRLLFRNSSGWFHREPKLVQRAILLSWMAIAFLMFLSYDHLSIPPYFDLRQAAENRRGAMVQSLDQVNPEEPRMSLHPASGNHYKLMIVPVFAVATTQHPLLFREHMWFTALAFVLALACYMSTVRRTGGHPENDDEDSSWRFGQNFSLPPRALVLFALDNVFSLFLAGSAEQSSRIRYSKLRNFAETEDRMEDLLKTLMPPLVVEQLRGLPPGSELPSHYFPAATVVQSDLSGFTALCKSRNPKDVVEFISELFGAFDELTDKHGVYKVETVGDAYIAGQAAGALTEDHDPVSVIKFGLDMVNATKAWSKRRGWAVACRVGVHTGTCVGGIVGDAMQRYHLFGELMTIVEVLESTALENYVQVSSACREAALYPPESDSEGAVLSPSNFRRPREIDIRFEEREIERLKTSKGEIHEFAEVGGQTFMASAV
eukprot:TRINITY_DN3269_c0_g8_i1.p1 TRINITY_DN3269_c0_g8~~TRINITY_DN3269_c0_g8_i1.p1  ORF type:complete len:1328 (+),score=287.69 TRINITY_DN3269_c0_g8_i1:75-4058(+)